MSQDMLVEVKHLKEYFNINTGMFSSKPLKAVDDVSFSIRRGETLGLVGESGCGKTTVGRTLLHLYKPTDGEIWFDGKQIVTKKDIAEYRKKTAMVFQDPMTSLNPVKTIGEQIREVITYHFGTDKETAKQQAETVRNEARAYQNAQLPQAEAKADELLRNAEYLKQKRINEATEQVAMFEAMYKEYSMPSMPRIRRLPGPGCTMKPFPKPCRT